MPSSLRFVLLLVGLAVVSAVASIFVLKRQDAAQARVAAEQLTGGHVDAGKASFGRYGCGACHRITGVPGAQGMVGPALDGIAGRAHIAGVLANRPDRMVLWLRHPQRVVPGNGMPEQGVTQRDGRDMAAFLYTLR